MRLQPTLISGCGRSVLRWQGERASTGISAESQPNAGGFVRRCAVGQDTRFAGRASGRVPLGLSGTASQVVVAGPHVDKRGRMEQPGSTPIIPTRVEPSLAQPKTLASVGGADTVASVTASEMATPRVRWFISRGLKRAMDVVGSALALIALSPLMIVLTMALMVETGGHPIFVQHRIGRSGSRFKIFKFRTMSRGAEDQLLDKLQQDADLAREWAELRKLRNDPRVTRVGRILRKYSLDELPQFVNVLIGQMSLVGPRPIVDEELPLFGEHLPTVLTMRPGLTGLWGISGRNELGYDERVRLEARYVRKWTLGLDISIMLRTIPRVIRGRGAF